MGLHGKDMHESYDSTLTTLDQGVRPGEEAFPFQPDCPFLVTNAYHLHRTFGANLPTVDFHCKINIKRIRQGVLEVAILSLQFLPSSWKENHVTWVVYSLKAPAKFGVTPQGSYE